MLKIKKFLILIVIVLLAPYVYSVGYAPPCNPTPGIFIPGGSNLFPGAPDEGLCVDCNADDGVCLDDITDNYCVLNSAYDPDCSFYEKEKFTGRAYLNKAWLDLDYDWCNDGIDNEGTSGDGYTDFEDGDCNTENLVSITYSPDPVPEPSTFQVNCNFNPTANGEEITFGNYRPTVNAYYTLTDKCTIGPSWSGNTATFTCQSTSSIICESLQEYPYNKDSITQSINLQLSSCASKGGVLNCQEAYYCTNQVEASDGPCCLTCSPDIRDPDGDGLTTYDEIITYQTNPSNADSDGDTIDDGTEVETGTNPTQKDTDGDGLNDNVDPDPLDPDGDGDGIDFGIDVDDSDPCSKLSTGDNCGSLVCDTDTDGDNLYTAISDSPITGANCDSLPLDRDNDGYNGPTWDGNDCNDNDYYINPSITEICNDLIDNNCNNWIDQQDPRCVVITSISAPEVASQGVNFELRCTSTIDSDCVGVKINSIPQDCFSHWEGSIAVFTCSTSSIGIANLECYISNKPGGICKVGTATSTPIPSSKTTKIEILTSVCSARSQVECILDNVCEWCPDCSSDNPKFSSGFPSPGTCVSKDSCIEKYQCRADECTAICDKDSWANCLGYQTCTELTTCLCQDKSCTVDNIGETSTHSGTQDIFCCQGSTTPPWTLMDGTLTETNCQDNKDNDCDGKTDCNDEDCDGLTNALGLTCCLTSSQSLCDTLSTECTDFTSCSNDFTKRGSQYTYNCISNICQQNSGISCDVSCNTECCIPGQQDCKPVGTPSDIDSDGKTEMCTSTEGKGDWLGADCTITACLSTNNIDYNCINPDDCNALNTGNCGEKTCIDYQCGTKIATNPVEKCQTYSTSQGYECAEIDPSDTCEESSPGEFNCIFTGQSELCSNLHPDEVDSNDGFDVGCAPNLKCEEDLCQGEDVTSSPCCLCHSQCIADVGDTSKAPYTIEECEVAENGQWVDQDCPQGG